MLKKAKVFHENQSVQERIMDSNDLERESGITILNKNTTIMYKDTKINIIDTPDHLDFGGEVECVLNMVEGVLLVVDSVERPMPQTQFVLKKALEFRHSVVVVCDFHVVYASAIKGQAGLSSDNIGNNLGPLFEAILRCIPEPAIDPNGPFQMLATNLDFDEHKGGIVIGRVNLGTMHRGMEIKVCTSDEKFRLGKVSELFVYENFTKVLAEMVEAGDICVVYGISDVLIGETLADKFDGSSFPRIKIEDRTMKMAFSINTDHLWGVRGNM
ncbi:hypothetical protein SUGI_1073510 [Cryptomeria japonica]|nr:hypothetical protein SUGI_1073510 [Cryptomeria japonica]